MKQSNLMKSMQRHLSNEQKLIKNLVIIRMQSMTSKKQKVLTRQDLMCNKNYEKLKLH